MIRYRSCARRRLLPLVSCSARSDMLTAALVGSRHFFLPASLVTASVGDDLLLLLLLFLSAAGAEDFIATTFPDESSSTMIAEEDEESAAAEDDPACASAWTKNPENAASSSSSYSYSDSSSSSSSCSSSASAPPSASSSPIAPDTTSDDELFPPSSDAAFVDCSTMLLLPSTGICCGPSFKSASPSTIPGDDSGSAAMTPSSSLLVDPVPLVEARRRRAAELAAEDVLVDMSAFPTTAVTPPVV
mmetsp:Transcript_26192/g.62224  ORF Transcript_26192/g.62224 Transcript_26192/m.62224 type:complete len:245 (-) Transcript_26192:270-1004(-)